MRDWKPKAGMLVKHFKGGIYVVISVAKHTETEESLVVYQNIEDGQVYARPYDMFISPVDKDKYPEATQEYRLEELVDATPQQIAQTIVNSFENLVEAARINGTPIRYDDSTEEDLVLYFNEEYSKIFVDKSFIR